MQHALHQLHVAVRPLDVYGGPTKTHRYAKLGLEGPQVGTTGAGELEQQPGIGDFDVGGYSGLYGAALRGGFDTQSLACPVLAREPQAYRQTRVSGPRSTAVSRRS